jgi:hypothetical protein
MVVQVHYTSRSAFGLCNGSMRQTVRGNRQGNESQNSIANLVGSFIPAALGRYARCERAKQGAG